jgi:phospholipase/carboxylesterase
MLDTIEVGTGERASITIIWMHGLGADGHDFEPIVAELRLPFAARFIFPHAPMRPVTISGGMQMRAWYDLLALAHGTQEDAVGIRASANSVRMLIDREVSRGMHSERIVLAGFSQGGALALHTALRDVRSLGGVLALSTYLPLPDTLSDEGTEANRRIPIFMAHGDYDPVIPPGFAAASRDRLIAADYDVEWHAYPIGHSVCATEVRDIADWLSGLFIPR